MEMSIRRNNVVVMHNNKASKSNGSPDKKINLVSTFILKLNGMGYTLDGQSIRELLSLGEVSSLVLMKDMLKSVEALVGDKNYEIFYKGFPKEVMNTTEDVLYFNSFMHYVFGIIPTEQSERENLEINLDKELYTKDFSVLKFDTADYYTGLLSDLISTKVAPSVSDREDIEFLISTLSDKEVSTVLATSEIPFKEVVSIVVGTLHGSNRLNKVDLTTTIKTATDLLRVIAYLNTGSAVITPHMSFKLKNSDRRFILNILESLSNPVEDLLRNKLVWRDIAKLLHAKKSTHPRTVEYLDYIFDSKKYVSYNSKVEPLMLKYKETLSNELLKELLELLEQRPSELGRRLDALVRYSNTKIEVNNQFRMITTSFAKVASDMNSRVLYQIRNHFLNRTSEEVPRLINIKDVSVLLNQEAPLAESRVQTIIHLVDQALAAQYVYLEPLGKVYIDEGLEKYALTTSERTSSKSNLNPLTSGTRIKLASKEGSDVLRTFVFWKNPEDDMGLDLYSNHIDIDSSIVFLDENFYNVADCSYYNLIAHDSKHNILAVHSGDITDAPNGASEYVDVDVSQAKESGVRYISFNINSYSSQSLSDIGTVRGGFMWLNKSETMKGSVYNEQFIQSSNDITTENTNSLVLVIDLETMEMIWIDTPTSNIKNLNNVDSTRVQDSLVVMKYALQQYTSLHDLYTIHALARGSEIVATKEEADVVFETPNAETPLDISDIVSNWI